MSNIHWPRRPHLCNTGDRVCEKQPERVMRLFIDGKDIGTIRWCGEIVMILNYPGLTTQEITP